MVTLVPFRRLLRFDARTRDDLSLWVRDLWFDTESLTAQRLIVEPLRASGGPRAAVPPSVVRIDAEAHFVRVDVNAESLEEVPDTSAAPPVRLAAPASETDRLQGWPKPHEQPVVPPSRADRSGRTLPQPSPSHRSAQRLLKGALRTPDGERFGAVSDLLLDAESLAVQQIVVRPHRHWPFGRRLLSAGEAVRGLDWERGELLVEGSRETVRRAPHLRAGARTS